MFAHVQLKASDFVVGKPLPWDVYGEGDKLLLRKGHVIESLDVVQELLQRGLFINVSPAEQDAYAKNRVNPPKPEHPSALRLINHANRSLERLLYNLSNEPDAQGKIVDITKALIDATSVNPDIVVASIFLNQTAASYAIHHCTDTAIVALQIANAMKKSEAEIQVIMAAALTMNIAMLRQHDQLANKREPLTEKEAELIKNHPAQGVEILRQAGITDEQWLSYVLLHHENEDGGGYPLGHNVKTIPQNAKILALADRYCAAVSNRKYRKTLLPSAALRDVLVSNGKPVDPVLAAYFIKELGTYPPGTFVRLQNGETAVVTNRGETATTPTVHAFIGPRGTPLSFPVKRNTNKEAFAIRDTLYSEQAVLVFSMQQLWGDEAAL